MRTTLLCSLVLLCGTQVAQAQQWGGYPSQANNYQTPQTAPNANYPNGYYQAPPQVPQNANYPNGYNPYYRNAGPRPYYPVTNSYGGGNPYGYQGYRYYPARYAYNPGTVPSYYYPAYRPYPTYAGNSYAAGSAVSYVQAPPAPAAEQATEAATEPATEPAAEPAVAPTYTWAPSAASPVAEEPHVRFHRPCNEKWWVAGNYIMAFVRPGGLSTPLVTAGSPNDFPQGALGQPATKVLFGGNIPYPMTSGFRLEAGYFFDNADVLSVEVGGFYLFPSYVKYTAAADGGGNPLIARPFFSTGDQQQWSLQTSIPGLITGSTSIDSKSEFGGMELNGRAHAYWGERCHADALIGFRYLRLVETLKIGDRITPLQAGFLTFNQQPVDPPDYVADEDLFRTTNNFFGLQVGGRLRWEFDRFSLSSFGKVGIGITQEQVEIAGSTTLVSANGNQVASGGLLALPTNIGTHNRNIFGAMQEFGVNFGVEVTKNVRVQLGYTCLVWDSVVRPGSQIDPNVNRGQIPGGSQFGNFNGPLAPNFRFKEDFFLVNTLNLGVELHY